MVKILLLGEGPLAQIISLKKWGGILERAQALKLGSYDLNLSWTLGNRHSL